MWIKKTLTLVMLLAMATVMSFTVQAETTVTTETRDYDPNEYSGRPAHPLFACTTVDHKCRVADNYTGLRYIGNLQLSTCYQENTALALLDWAFGGFKFTSNFYVYCQDKDDECLKYTKPDEHNKLNFSKFASDMEQSVRDQTNCKPTFSCFALDDMDDDCFQIGQAVAPDPQIQSEE